MYTARINFFSAAETKAYSLPSLSIQFEYFLHLCATISIISEEIGSIVRKKICSIVCFDRGKEREKGWRMIR